VTAVAHDEPPADPAEAEMPEADFRVIQRATELCERAPVRELTAEPDCLITHATKILGAQIRAFQLLAERREAVTNLTADGHSTREVGEILGVSNATVSRDVTNVTAIDAVAVLAADEVEPLVPDWRQIAQDAWHEGWAQAAKEYQFARMRR
jgi:hypothetical protein